MTEARAHDPFQSNPEEFRYRWYGKSLGQLTGSTGYDLGGLASIPEPSTFHLSLTSMVVAMLCRRKSPMR
jgi:hypothetical protein